MKRNRAPCPAPPLYVIAERRERDCWNVLTRHTAGCAICLEARKIHDLNGYGCDTGRACREEWLRAARRRYELSPYRKLTPGNPSSEQQPEEKQ